MECCSSPSRKMRLFKSQRNCPTAASSRYCGSSITARSSFTRSCIALPLSCPPEPGFTACRRDPRYCCCPRSAPPPRTPLLQLLDRNIEVGGVHHAIALELHPHAISSRARELHTELDLRAAIGNERMGVDQVDQIVARRQHVCPCADVFFQAVGGRYPEIDLRLLRGDRLRWIGGHFHLHVLHLLGRIIAR